MINYTLSNKAEEDISGIYDYSVNAHGTIQAEAYLVALHEALIILAETPSIGTSVEEIRKSYLQFPVHRHMVFYKKVDDGIFVVRVLHQQMKYSMHLSD
ncbi:type II toxin-antitoxin system RelE/ParE family toxin [Aestuariibacter salexigens]|uniref:type II toxin-antitoxin system RelE/ParE family toxin n=1 Tax=Aestuariibacter salexigens TaxID=226010 RepID=UPI00047BEC16|nr:type II toxin-antitoxin system RelE/ParE family toxin [Aestuariibacter salexigens]